MRGRLGVSKVALVGERQLKVGASKLDLNPLHAVYIDMNKTGWLTGTGLELAFLHFCSICVSSCLSIDIENELLNAHYYICIHHARERERERGVTRETTHDRRINQWLEPRQGSKHDRHVLRSRQLPNSKLRSNDMPSTETLQGSLKRPGSTVKIMKCPGCQTSRLSNFPVVKLPGWVL